MSVILNILAGAFKEAGTEAVVSVLQKLHDSDLPNYKKALLGGKLLADTLEPVVDKSKTKIDDALVEGISNAIQTSAERNGVDLSVFDSFIADAEAKIAAE